MHFRKLLYPGVLVLATLVLMANSNGVAHQQNKDRTGAPGSQNTCQQCHGGGSYAPQIQAGLILDGVVVNGYQPGAVHELVIEVASTGSPQGFGVHGTVVFPDGSNAGTLNDQDANDCIWLDEVDGRHIFEQNDLCSDGVFVVEWVAPGPGSGDVDVYVASIAANGNGTSTGDVFVGGQFTFSEAVNAVGEEQAGAGIQCWSGDAGVIEFEASGPGEVLVLSTDGRILWEGGLDAGRTPVQLGHAGLVLVRLSDARGISTRKVWI